jgi:hypothetical protein
VALCIAKDYVHCLYPGCQQLWRACRLPAAAHLAPREPAVQGVVACLHGLEQVLYHLQDITGGATQVRCLHVPSKPHLLQQHRDQPSPATQYSTIHLFAVALLHDALHMHAGCIPLLHFALFLHAGCIYALTACKSMLALLCQACGTY